MNNLRKEQIVKQLENHGLKNLKQLSDDELVTLFKQTTINWTNKITSINHKEKIIKNEDSTLLISTIQNINNINDIYKAVNNLIDQYTYSDIKEAIINNLKSSIFDTAITILDIKHTQYLENIVEKIENKIKIMPIEEMYFFTNFIESNRDNIEFLKSILKMLSNDKILNSIKYITNAKKYIITNFMPQDLESNYKQYYNNSKEKQDLIKKLKDMNASYTRKQLDNMTRNDLVDIIKSIKQRELDEKKDKEDFEKYSFLLKQALYKDDNDTFNALIIQILEDVSVDCLAQIRGYFKTQDPLFENKFKKAQIEWQELKINNRYK